ncbi:MULTISPECIES: hypothetical protein [unclassified Microcoleus]
MNSMKQPIRLAKFLAFALSVLMFCFPTAAMADTCTSSENPVIPQPLRQIKIDNGSFNVDTNIRCLKESKRIDTAVVSLEPSTATGIIDKIEITGPGGKREFGCMASKVQQGTNLIELCGGPAILEAGDVRYQAQGSGFGTEPAILSINFKSN